MAGDYTVVLKVVDDHGIESDPVSIKLKIEKTAPSLQVRKSLVDDTNQLVKLGIDVSYPGRLNVRQWLVHWGDGSSSSVQVLSNKLAIAHYYQKASETITYPITLTLIDSNGQGSDIVWSVASHTVAGVTQTPVVEPQLQLTQVVEEVVMAENGPVIIDTGFASPVATPTITGSSKNEALIIRTDLDTTTTSRLQFWNFQPVNHKIKPDTTSRFNMTLSGDHALILPPIEPIAAVNEDRDLWSELLDEDEEFDFVNNETIDRYESETFDQAVKEWDEELVLLD